MKLVRAQGAIGGNGRLKVFRPQGIADRPVERVTERVQVTAGQGHACRHGMAAEFFHHPRVPGINHGEHVADMQARDGTGRTLDVLAVVVRRKRNRRAVSLLADTGRQYADHTLVPVGVKQGQAPWQALDVQRHGRQQVLSLGFHIFFDGATFTIEGIQFSSQALGFVTAVRQQAGNAHAHIVQATGSIQPWANHKPEIRGADFAVIAACHFQQRQNTGAGLPLADAAQALFHEDAVVMVQGNNVRYCAKRHKIQQIAEIRLRLWQQALLTQMLSKSRQHIEHHTHARRVLAQEGAAGLVGVHDGVRLRQGFTGQVMIGHNHPDAQFPGCANTFHGGNTVVHGHQQVRQRTLISQPVDNARRQSITVGKPAGHTEVNIVQPQHPQPQHGNCRAGGAVGVEVPKHQHSLLTGDGVRQERNGTVDTS